MDVRRVDTSLLYGQNMSSPATVIDALRAYSVSHRSEPFSLASGASSCHYIDVKSALCRPFVLRKVSAEIIELAAAEGIPFDYVGGLTMGADAVSVGVSLASGAKWFSVRKEPKSRGHARAIEGVALGPGSRVLIVDDVMSTGGSTLKAVESVRLTGATVVGVITVVDRGGYARTAMESVGVRYFPLVSHEELGIPSLGTE